MIALFLMAAVLLVLPAAPALATHVECGDTITRDTTLDSDVVCEGETYGVTAITIAADDVTLDLAGHAVSGEAAYHEGSNGIAADAPRTGLTIRGGTVRGFGAGINLLASRTVVAGMKSLDNGGVGIWVRGDDNVVRENEVRHTGEFGISLHGDRVVLDRNRVGGMIGCARVTGESPRLTRNVLEDCYWAGGIDRYTTAIVARNTVSDNASGFSVFGDGAQVLRNDFSANEGTGLVVSDPRALVDRNIANDNRLDHPNNPSSGIEIHVPGAVVSRNRADRNQAYGIDAVPGTIDGGGNRARGNGNPAQCLNITCSN
jgi:hypothetical protein